MKSYRYPSRIFDKRWYWFTTPSGDEAGDMVNIFSYEKKEDSGYKLKQGLTTVITLADDIEALWEKMRKRYVREQIGKGERNGIRVVVNDDWKKLIPIYKDFRQGKHLTNDNPQVFEECFVVNAYDGNRVVAGGAFIEDGIHMRAYVLASRRFQKDGRERELVGQANRMIIWEAIKYAKAKGYTIFDLGGINPESEVPWERTLAEFKESFGGERRECYYYSRVSSPILKLLLRMRSFLHI